MRCPHCTDGLVLRGNTDPLRDLGGEYELCLHCGGSGKLGTAEARRIAKQEADDKEAAQKAASADASWPAMPVWAVRGDDPAAGSYC